MDKASVAALEESQAAQFPKLPDRHAVEAGDNTHRTTAPAHRHDMRYKHVSCRTSPSFSRGSFQQPLDFPTSSVGAGKTWPDIEQLQPWIWYDLVVEVMLGNSVSLS